MENVIVAVFKDQSKTYQALSELKSKVVTEQYAILEAAVVKKEQERIVMTDGFSASGNGEWLTGGLIGSIVGILGGPIGMLLGGSLGAIIGATKEGDDKLDNASIMFTTAEKLVNGDLALVLLAQEQREHAMDHYLLQLDPVYIMRKDVEVVEEEIERAQEVEQELRRDARERMRERRQEERQEKLDSFKSKIKMEFEQLKDKFSSN
ncbi:DUF456 domain-containing protein [Paenibacillus sp. 1001270B_150601_E10]|uniref:DUF456 domain-containing protein n=1 Tax=Paenibacillus sp. 1001270B_150601_E10 TaxID=2787079 RepID=UPI00189FBE3C|nr:DUF456 domain-containing protein [Paenibacillus sp. 1001270B_150601_E10]